MKILTISQKEDRKIKAFRSGRPGIISIWDIMVRDILYLGFDNIIPANGIFISKYGIKYNESFVTGESD